MSNAERIASSQFSALGVVGPERLPPEIVELLTLALRRGARTFFSRLTGHPAFVMSSSLAGLLKRRQITLEDAEARSQYVKELRQLLAQ